MKSVEIELFGCCNRKCVFCPNSNTNSEDIRCMDDITFSNMIKILANVENIHICGYSEHTMFGIEYIENRLREIYNLNKNVTLNTNGDFMDNIGEWLNYVDRIDISRYDGEFIEYVLNILNKLPDFNVNIFESNMVILKKGNKMVKIMDILNLKKLCNRGGLIPTLNSYNIRSKKCKIFPIKEYVFINSDGNVYPCCNLNSRFTTKHNELILFNVNDDIIDKNNIDNIKHNLVHNPSVYDSCRYCNYKEDDYN